MIIPSQPAGEPAGLIRKYYPNLGQQLPSPALPELAGDWFSDLSKLGAEDIDHYVSDRHERASNKAEFLACLAMLLAEAEQHAHLPGYGYRRHYPLDYLTPERESEIEARGRAALRGVRAWHTLASLSPIEQFLDRAHKIELWQNERHQLATREARREEWNEEYGVMLLALQRAVPTAKKKLLRAAYTELKRLLPTLEASQPLEWQRRYDEGRPFFPISLKTTYTYSVFVPLRPTQNAEIQITECFFLHLYLHLFEKEWHVWQALILLAGALGEAAPPTPETFQGKQTEPAPAAQPLDPPAAPATTEPPQPGSPALDAPAPTVAAPAGVTATRPQKRQENLLEMLCGGYKPDQLLKVIGGDGLGLYDTFRKQPNDTATSTAWATLYWGLIYKGFLPTGITNEKAAGLLKTTFGAKTSKTRIGVTNPDVSQKPGKGTCLARIVDLLERLPA